MIRLLTALIILILAVRVSAEVSSESSPDYGAVSSYISSKYKVSYDLSTHFVDIAIKISHDVGIDYALILAVAAVESSFNPFAQSKKGAKGLMQVMPHIHHKKFQPFGGISAAFKPHVNMHVGALILSEYIAKSGSLNSALRLYVGASSPSISDGGYASRVLAEHRKIKSMVVS